MVHVLFLSASFDILLPSDFVFVIKLDYFFERCRDIYILFNRLVYNMSYYHSFHDEILF